MNVDKAVYAAVSTIYFADNSDYLSALWEVVKCLNPDLADLLEEDELAAYRKAADAIGLSEDE
jgi:hypothetical protein